MRYLVSTLVLLSLVGCTGDTPEAIPIDTVKRAEALCMPLSGIKHMNVSTYIQGDPRFSNTYTTRIHVVCNDNNGSFEQQWDWPMPSMK